ncbi:MAG TPA: type I polyketide synthase, partial [Saliniramus sp.]|nr:type I polyketide synthase [Saliniramus sp.]
MKSNLGHTEAAAGIAGLIKAILVAQKGIAPPQAGFETLNPEIAALDLPITIPKAPTELAGVDGRRIVGVSAFGFSGTNAHVFVEAHSAFDERTATDVASVFAVSARSETGLEGAVERWSAYLAATDENPRAVALTSTAGRKHWTHRVAVAAVSAVEAAKALADAPRHEAKAAPRVAFLFTGQGSQYCGMCKRLYETEPLFRQALARMAAVLDEELGIDSLSLMFGAEPFDRTDYAQPLLVATELALASVWRELGVEPVAAMGHSVGEFAAAAVAGAMSEIDALRLAVARGRAMQALPSGGGMMAVFSDAEGIAPFMERAGGVLAIAAVNGPSSLVIAGETAALDRLRELLEADGQDCRPLAVSHAFHSPLIDPALSALREAAERIGTGRAVIPLISNVTGAMLSQIDADYWVEHARRPVRFADGVRALEAMKIDVFLEIGPDAVLTSLAGMTSPGITRVPSLRRGRADDRVLAEAIAALHCAGADLAWRKTGGGHLPPVRAPLVQFERSRHWLETPDGAARPRPARPERLRSEPEDEKGSPLVYDFYDELTVISQNYADTVGDATHEEGHLTFGLLPRNETGFSWVRAL